MMFAVLKKYYVRNTKKIPTPNKVNVHKNYVIIKWYFVDILGIRTFVP